jgi:carboxymethylenebutenolidase
MPSSNKSLPIPQEAFDWYDEYAHGVIDRRTFLARLATLSVAVPLVSLTAALTPNYALAEQVSFNDPAILATYVTFASPLGHGEGRGYLVLPADVASTKAPTVLVIHENRGLNPYIKDVARRLAKAGFIAFAPDALHPVGGYPGNDDQGRAMQSAMDRQKIEQDFIAAAAFIKAHPKGNGKLGAVGFCFGGYIVNMLAATIPESLSAGVPFYGTPAAQEIRAEVRGPLLVQLAGLDKRVNDTWPDYEATLKQQGANYTMHEYAGVNHGFHNDSTGRYDEAAAELAWQRTLGFFRQHLS